MLAAKPPLDEERAGLPKHFFCRFHDRRTITVIGGLCSWPLLLICYDLYSI